MTIVHINRNFFTNRIHLNIFNALATNKIYGKIIIYHYGEYSKNNQDNNIVLIKIPRVLRYFPITRSLLLSVLILRKKIVNQETIIHAHTLCSDGFIAFFLSILKRVKYVCTIRNTDVNGYIKKVKLLLPFVKLVVKRAEKIVFLSPSYEKKSLSVTNDPSKHVILPSFLEKFWEMTLPDLPNLIDDRITTYKKTNGLLRFIYVGRLVPGKKIMDMVTFFVKRNLAIDIYGTGPEVEKIEKIGASNKKIRYCGPIDNKELPKILRNYEISINFSPSESFGLFFVESLFMGVIPIFNKDEGIDGLFNWLDTTALMSDPKSVDKAVNQTRENYLQYLERLRTENLKIFTQDYFMARYIGILRSISQ